jgi:glycosyltransferase involved in cell wall biosynthesis
MKILFFQHAVGRGGATVSLRYLVSGLVERGHDVHVALNAGGRELAEIYTGVGAECHVVSTIPSFLHTTAAHVSPLAPRTLLATAKMITRLPAAGRSLQQLVKVLSPDVIHLNSATLGPTALALRSCGVPLVWHVREAPPFRSRGLRTKVLAGLMKRLAAETVFISQDDRRTWSGNRFGTVIYNCAAIKQLPDKAELAVLRESLGLDAGSRVVLFMGGLQKIKGIAQLCAGIPTIVARMPEARFVILGADPSPPSSHLAAVARRLASAVGLPPFHLRMLRLLASPSLAPYVRVLPSVDGVSNYLAMCDVLVFPAVSPHFARPVIEAALAGKPVVASKLGGVEEVVENNKTGLLVPAGAVAELVDAVLDLLGDEEKASRISAALQETAGDTFSISRHIDAVEAVYRRVVADVA